MTQDERDLTARLLRAHHMHVTRLIMEVEQLSRAVPEGHWRWHDLHPDGYTRKTEDELAADRERHARRLAELRTERAVTESALAAVEL